MLSRGRRGSCRTATGHAHTAADQQKQPGPESSRAEHQSRPSQARRAERSLTSKVGETGHRTRVRAPAYPTRRPAGTQLPDPIHLRHRGSIALEIHPHFGLERVADDEFLIRHTGVQGAVDLMAIELLDDVAHFDAEALGDLAVCDGE